MARPEYGTPYGIPFEFYASKSGMVPKYGYTKDQHEWRYFASTSGLSDMEALPLHQREVWRKESGLTPADNYSDTEHFEVWLNKAPLGARESLKQDQYSQRPVVNMFHNPSIVRATPGNTVVRRNLAPNPRFDLTGASVNGLARIEDPTSPYGTAGYRAPGTMTAWVSMHFTTPASLLPTGRRVYTARFWCATNVGLAIQNLSNNLTITTSWSGVMRRVDTGERLNNPVADGVWREYSITWTVPASQTTPWSIGVKHNTGTENPDGWAKVTGVLIEERPEVLPYFDGATTDNSGIAYSWEGTPHASPSVAKAGVKEVLRNHVRDPQFTAVPSVTTHSAVSASQVNDFTGTRTTTATRWTRIADGATRIADIIAPTMPGSGTTITVTFTLRSSVALPGTSVYARESVGTTGSQSQIGYFNIPAGVSTHTFTGPSHAIASTTGGGGIALVTSSGAIGNYLEVGQAIVTTTPLAVPYFDGLTTPESDFTPAWIGAAEGSASALYAIQASNAGSGAGSSTSFITWRTYFGEVGSRSYYTATSPNTFVSISGVTFDVGKTYTVIARVRLPQTMTGPLRGERLAIQVRASVGGQSGVTVAQSEVAPNVPGTYDLRLLFTVPENASSLSARLYHGGTAGSGDVYWTKVGIFQGEYNGPFFDGETPGALWEGTPNNSASRIAI